MKYVVVMFNEADPSGMKVYAAVGGGFIDKDSAQAWAQANCGHLAWVITTLEIITTVEPAT